MPFWAEYYLLRQFFHGGGGVEGKSEAWQVLGGVGTEFGLTSPD